MALGSLPPWLQINPRDYLLATQSGVQAGHAIADSAQRAFEEQQRMKMAADAQQQSQQQQVFENQLRQSQFQSPGRDGLYRERRRLTRPLRWQRSSGF